ncbi:MAG: AAA family ATPase [Methanomassiliicoccales archaeon]
MRITISGPPGSGKTTICRLLADRLGYAYVISGNVFREMAKQHGMSLVEFGALAQRDPRYDRMIDEAMIQRAMQEKDIILEGRLAAHNLTRRGIPAFKVYLDADPYTRAKRIVEREGNDLERTAREMREREECEAQRYLQWYGIDLKDRGVYDLIVDTAKLTPEEIVDLILRKMGRTNDADDC